MPYFAYGSNLNQDDLRAWCARQRLPYPLGDCIGRAWLPDFRLCFDTYSGTRRGGVANAVPHKGYAVLGAVFKVKRRGWDTLSIKEGAPGFYSKTDILILAETGPGLTEPMLCATCLLPPSDTFIRPNIHYQRAIAAGYEAHGLPLEQLEFAVRDLDRPIPLFVYGTLQRGRRLHAYMRGFDFVDEASVPGRLLHCGGFPGLIAGEKDERAHGEIYRVKPGFDAEELLAGLDSVEGFSGFGRHNLYERRIITVTNAAGKETPCWVYHWMGKVDLPVVEGGRWEK